MAGDNGLYLSITNTVRLWSTGLGLGAQQIAIAQSNVTPLLYPGWEPICVALDSHVHEH